MFCAGCLDFNVGLDGVYRVNDWAGQHMAIRGAWEDERIFVLQTQLLGQSRRQDLRFVPAEDGTTQVTIRNPLTGESTSVTCTPP